MDVDEPRGGGGPTGGGGRVETPNVIYIENPQEIIKKNLTIFNQTEAAEKALEAAYAAEVAARLEETASQIEEQQGTSTRAQKNKLNSAIKDALEARAFANKEQRKLEKAKETGFRSSLQGDNKIKYPCFFIGGRLYNLSDIRNMFKSVDSFLEMDFDDPKISDSDWAEIAHRVFELGRDVIDITNLKIEYDENGDPIVTGTYELPEKESFSSVKRDPFTRKDYTIEDLELMRRMSKNEPAAVSRGQEAKNEFTARERLVVGSHIPRYAMHILPTRTASSPPFFEIRVIPPLPTLYKRMTGFGGLSSIYTADKLHHTYKPIWDFLEAEAEAESAAVAGEEEHAVAGYQDYDSDDERLSQYSLGGRNKKSRSLTRKQRKSRRLIRKKKSRRLIRKKKSRKSRKLRKK